jgi:methylglyoxal/glyoxal reductase
MQAPPEYPTPQDTVAHVREYRTVKSVVLNNRVRMPMVGMGTWPLNYLKLALLVRKAAQLGYRSLDTASAYHNERWLGFGVKICGTPRQELFITTKLNNAEQRHGNVKKALRRSIRRLGVKNVDLYLMHWPVPELFLSSWKQMEELHRQGLAKAIGVCNFHRHHLERLLDQADIVPAVNQIELHPLLAQFPLVEFCNEASIQVEAYSPLARMHDKLVKSRTLVSLAEQYGRTVPQIILRWIYQRGIVSVPKSSSAVRLQENISIEDFVLSEKEMASIDQLDASFRVRHDPDNCDFTKL